MECFCFIQISQGVCPWLAFPAKSNVCVLSLSHFHLPNPLTGQILALSENIRLGWKAHPGTNTLAYLALS